jgi:hypothetical protein
MPPGLVKGTNRSWLSALPTHGARYQRAPVRDDIAGRVRQQETDDIACRIRRFGISSDLTSVFRPAQPQGGNGIWVKSRSRLATLQLTLTMLAKLALLAAPRNSTTLQSSQRAGPRRLVHRTWHELSYGRLEPRRQPPQSDEIGDVRGLYLYEALVELLLQDLEHIALTLGQLIQK